MIPLYLIVKIRGVQNRVQKIHHTNLRIHVVCLYFSTHSFFCSWILLCSCTENYIIKSMKKKQMNSITPSLLIPLVNGRHQSPLWSICMISLIRDFLVLITTTLFFLLFSSSAVSIPLKTRSCPRSATLLYMWTRCNRLFRQFNKKRLYKIQKS